MMTDRALSFARVAGLALAPAHLRGILRAMKNSIGANGKSESTSIDAVPSGVLPPVASTCASIHTRSGRSARHIRVVDVLLTGWIALIAGCESPALHFDPPSFVPVLQEWGAAGRPGVHWVTDHYDIYTTVQDAELRDYLPKYVETCYLLYEHLLPVAKDAAGPRMQIYLFSDRLEWDGFVRQRYPDRYPIYRKIASGGFTEGDTCVAYNCGRSVTLSVLAHEGMHQYIQTRLGSPVPAWFNEGLATYCETVEFRRNEPYFVPQRNTFRVNHLCQAMQNQTAQSLTEILATDAGAVLGVGLIQSTNVYYAQVWALMSFILRGQDGKYAHAVNEIAHDARDGTIRIKAQATRVASSSPAEMSFGQAVFETYVTTDADAFQSAMDAYVERLCWGR